MAKKEDEKEEDKKPKKAGDKSEDDNEPSSEVEVEIEGEEKKEPEEKKAKKADESETEVEIETPGETPAQKEERLSKSQQRKQRQREAREAKEREIAALRTQNAELVNRVSAIEQRGLSADVGRIENGLDEAQRQMQEAKDIIKRAFDEKNGEALAQAQEALFDARRRAEKLLEYKQGLAQRAQQPQTPDPLLMRHAKDWMAKNRWYDPRGYDSDSQVALTIDQGLAKDGWDPRTPEYWEEFSDRVAKYLPHRITRENKRIEEDDEDEPSSQTRGSGRESGGGSSKTTFRVSKDRVDALKEAGQWEQFNSDKTFRNRMIKRFKEADEKHASK